MIFKSLLHKQYNYTLVYFKFELWNPYPTALNQKVGVSEEGGQ